VLATKNLEYPFYGMNLYRKHTDTPYEELAAAARQIQSEVYAQKH